MRTFQGLQRSVWSDYLIKPGGLLNLLRRALDGNQMAGQPPAGFTTTPEGRRLIATSNDPPRDPANSARRINPHSPDGTVFAVQWV
jgi:hypothetical protein